MVSRALADTWRTACYSASPGMRRTSLRDDDPIARQRALGLGADVLFVQLAGPTLLTVQIAREPAGTTGSST